MTDTSYDRAPRDISISAEAERRTLSDVGIFTVAPSLAVILTAMSFWVGHWVPGISLGLVVLAIAQISNMIPLADLMNLHMRRRANQQASDCGKTSKGRS